MFRDDKDFAAFERTMLQAHERFPLRILSYCVMPNHWHFVAWPERDGDLTAFFRWLTNTHAIRWRVSHRTVGYGRLYQGRFKSFPIECDEHLLTVCRYVERNPLAAELVRKAERWRWSSLWARKRGDESLRSMLCEWPVRLPADWVRTVNAPLMPKEIAKLETSETRSRPFGSDQWVAHTVKKLGLSHTVRPQGRPSKAIT